MKLNAPDSAVSSLAAQGFAATAQIQAGPRFSAYRLTRDSQDFFGKFALTTDLARQLENELWYNLTLNRLADAIPSLRMRGVSIISSGPGWYVAEFVAGQPLLEREFGTESAVAPHIERLAQTLARLDQQLVVSSHQQPIYELSNSAPYSNLLVKVDGWMKKPQETGLISAQRLKQAKTLIEEYRRHIYPAFQHGDFVPWHILSLPDESWRLLDGEHASLIKPRFYDLAYLYSRLFTRFSAATEAPRLLRLFLDASTLNEQEFLSAFLPVLTLRALGMHADALVDLNTMDYRPAATALLDKCLSRQLSALG